MRVDYLGLEAFVAVAEMGSFSRAARRLNLSQTALSHRIKKVEEDLGTQLLTRSSREVSLTMAGQNLLPQVRSQLELLADLYGQVRDGGQKARRKLVFSCLPTVSSYYMPELMRRFTEGHPDLQLSLLDQTAGEVVKRVQDGDAEFGITLMGATPWDLEVETLCTEPYLVLVGSRHRLAGQASLTREDLLNEPLVRIRTQSTNRKVIEETLGDISRRLDWRYEVLNASTAMSMVAAGGAITILPEMIMHMSPDKIVGLPFSDVHPTRDIVAIQRRGVPLSPAAQDMLDLIRDQLSGPIRRPATPAD